VPEKEKANRNDWLLLFRAPIRKPDTASYLLVQDVHLHIRIQFLFPLEIKEEHHDIV
jgi:hypothetical protein